MLRIEKGGRFVENQDIRHLGQGPGDQGQPSLAAAELVYRPFGESAETDVAQGFASEADDRPPTGRRKAGRRPPGP